MRGFVDLHSHWIANIDDGARSIDAGIDLLTRLHQAGFSIVVATPHMRPGMFNNEKATLEAAFESMQPAIVAARARDVKLPDTYLSSEHFFDEIVFERLRRGQGVPYPNVPSPAAKAKDGSLARAPIERSALVEFGPLAFPAFVQQRFFDLKRAGITPILAHPERYEPVWKDDECLTPLFDAGAHLLLDVCSIVGKYGRSAQRAAEKLLEEDAYQAACSDAHKPDDVDVVVRAIERLEVLVGAKEAYRLLADAPAKILSGERETPG